MGLLIGKIFLTIQLHDGLGRGIGQGALEDSVERAFLLQYAGLTHGFHIFWIIFVFEAFGAHGSGVEQHESRGK
jgi:hypothetical protein